MSDDEGSDGGASAIDEVRSEDGESPIGVPKSPSNESSRPPRSPSAEPPMSPSAESPVGSPKSLVGSPNSPVGSPRSPVGSPIGSPHSPVGSSKSPVGSPIGSPQSPVGSAPNSPVGSPKSSIGSPRSSASEADQSAAVRDRATDDDASVKSSSPPPEGRPVSGERSPMLKDDDMDDIEERSSTNSALSKSPSMSPRSPIQSDGENAEASVEKGSEVSGDAEKSGKKEEEGADEANPDDEHVAEDSRKRELSPGSDHEEAGTSKRRRVVMSSDDEDDEADSPRSKREGSASGDEERGEVGVGELMTTIFGEESDEERDADGDDKKGSRSKGDDDEPRYVRDEDDDDGGGTVWDFDEMLRAKKAEKKGHRRHRRDGSIFIAGDADIQIKMTIDAMKDAAKDDRHSNMERKPALRKRKMLPHVKSLLMKHDLMEAIIDNGMMNAVSEWLAPLPDKSLPALEIRTDLLKILQDYGRIEPGTLKQSGLGRAVMLLYKHPRESKDNKALASKLISEWARPIFQLDTDFRTMSKEERMQRDYAQLPEVKRQRIGARPEESHDAEKTRGPRPGDKGFIIRARVPRPSEKDYVVRPKSSVETPFQGATKSRQNSRFEKKQREFRERTKINKMTRAVGVSIEGRKMDI